MKMSDVPEVQEIATQLETNQKFHDWLANHPSDCLALHANLSVEKIPIKRETSLEFLAKHKQNCLDRLKELGVEE